MGDILTLCPTGGRMIDAHNCKLLTLDCVNLGRKKKEISASPPVLLAVFNKIIMFNLIKKYMSNKKNNTGARNSGDFNSGDFNSGDFNSGDFNSGNFNSGYRNSGDFNSGNFNSGDFNSGDFNSGDFNSGWFNRNEPKMRMFEKESEYTYSEFREEFGYNDISLPTCSWINSDNMTDKEKKDVTGWETTGGYLKTLDYKEAWAKAWSEASEKQKNWYKSLPNFDATIFKDITGIDITESLIGTIAEVKIGGKTYKAKIVE